MGSKERQPPVFDPLDAEIRRDPLPHYAALHSSCSGPVSPVPGEENFWLVSGHAEVVRVLSDPFVFDNQPIPRMGTQVLSTMAPDQHRRVRGAVASMFTPRALAALRPEIERIAEAHTSSLLRLGRGDLMEHWALPIPLHTIAYMFGLDTSPVMIGKLKCWGDAVLRCLVPLGGTGPKPEALPTDGLCRLAAAMKSSNVVVGELERLLGRETTEELLSPGLATQGSPGEPRLSASLYPKHVALIPELILAIARTYIARRERPGDRIIDLFVAAVRRREISEAELVFGCIQVLVAGYESTANALASAVKRLAQHPQVIPALRADPEALKPFIEEVLRLDDPLPRTLRRTNTAVELGGVMLPKDAQLIVLIGAANVDPAKIARPLEFDSKRRGQTHLSFGKGPHACLGAALSRMELEIAIRHLIARARTCLLDPQRPPQFIADKDIGLYGYESLHVLIEEEHEALAHGRPRLQTGEQ